MQRERVLARDRVRAGGLVFVKRVVQEPQAVLEVAEELLLLLLDRWSGSRLALSRSSGYGLLMTSATTGHELVQERLAPAHLVGVEHGPAEQAADDVALLLGPGPDVFVDAEGQGPGVVGHAADADAVGLVALVFDAQRARRPRRRSA